MLLGPDELKTFMASEIAKWAGIIGKMNIDRM